MELIFVSHSRQPNRQRQSSLLKVYLHHKMTQHPRKEYGANNHTHIQIPPLSSALGGSFLVQP
jgi:hypothetical protein